MPTSPLGTAIVAVRNVPRAKGGRMSLKDFSRVNDH